MQVVLVKFRDPTTHNHWATKEDAEKGTCRVCYACGILLTENKDIVRVSLLLSDDKESVSDWVDIPNGCVLSVEVIKEIDWEEAEKCQVRRYIPFTS